MTDKSASSTPAKPPQPPNCSGDEISAPNSQIPNLSSSAVPSSVDLPHIFSPQLVHSQLQVSPSGTLDFPPKLPATSQHQSNLMSPASNFQMQPAAQRSGSMSRMSQIQQQFGMAMAAAGAIRPGMYGGQMSFGGQQQQQLGTAIAQQAMMGQAGQFSMISSQDAPHFNIQSQIQSQPRQKTALTQSAQFHTANSSGKTMQGMQSMGVMGPLGLSSQIKANGSLSYGQQRSTHDQFRQQLSQQVALTCSQKLIGQSIQRGPSLTAMNSQLSRLTQNGQSTLVQGNISEQLWLKQLQAGMASPISPSYHIQQQRQRQQAFLPQQLSSPHLLQKSLGLSQQHISQLVQAQLGTTQQHQAQFLHQQQLQQLQQQSPRIQGSIVSKSLTGSQSSKLVSGTKVTGEITNQGTEASNQLLGKRKIQDLVTQVDSSGKLDPEVEDLLLELADDFIDSVTTFACRLAKHRKSSSLESKDLLLHLEKNWHLMVPGFSRDDQKNHKVFVGALELQQMEGDAANTFKQAGKNSSIDWMIKSSPSSEQLSLPVASSHVLQKLP